MAGHATVCGCGYSLAGLASDSACPECGRLIEGTLLEHDAARAAAEQKRLPMLLGGCAVSALGLLLFGTLVSLLVAYPVTPLMGLGVGSASVAMVGWGVLNVVRGVRLYGGAD